MAFGVIEAVGTLMILGGLQFHFAPQLCFVAMGPLEPFFHAGVTMTETAAFILKGFGLFATLLGSILLFVKWNKANATPTGAVTLVLTALLALDVLQYDSYAFVLRPEWLYFVAFCALGVALLSKKDAAAGKKGSKKSQ